MVVAPRCDLFAIQIERYRRDAVVGIEDFLDLVVADFEHAQLAVAVVAASDEAFAIGAEGNRKRRTRLAGPILGHLAADWIPQAQAAIRPRAGHAAVIGGKCEIARGTDGPSRRI